MYTLPSMAPKGPSTRPQYLTDLQALLLSTFQCVLSPVLLKLQPSPSFKGSYQAFWPLSMNPSNPSLRYIFLSKMQISHHISLPADCSEIKVKLLNMAYTASLRLPPTPITPASPPLHHTSASHYPKCNLLVEDGEEGLFIPAKSFLH